VISIWDFLTLRNVILAILVLPLLTMLIFVPFLYSISKNAREWLTVFGFFGFVANIVLAVECCYRILNSILYYAMQKPTLVFDRKLERMVYYQEPYDFTYVVYAVIFLSISFLTWQLIDKVSPWELKRKKSSEITSLDLNK
jgi:cell division protein FtsW (lipid II flippase)